jgi:uncharacterized membrane protein YccF (DUF307 family)
MNSQVPLLFRFIWFVCAGLWLGTALTGVAWLCCVSIIGLPVGLWLFNRLPFVMTLKEPDLGTTLVVRDGFYYVHASRGQEPPLLLRLLYLVFIGWWLSALWLLAAHVMVASVIGMPIAFWMYNRVPKVLWLAEV